MNNSESLESLGNEFIDHLTAAVSITEKIKELSKDISVNDYKDFPNNDKLEAIEDNVNKLFKQIIS